MNLVKTVCLMIFAFGIATVTKYYDFAEWLEASPWLALPMIVFGGVGIVLLWGKED